MIVVETGVTVTDVPIICWRNVVTTTSVSAESDPDFPITNVANPSLGSKWKHDETESPVSAVEYLTVDVSQQQPMNYIAIAGHNLASAGVAIGIELASTNSPIGSAESVIEPFIPDDDGPLIFLLTMREVEGINISFTQGTAAPEIAVLYVGEYTVMEEGIQADHTPLWLGRVSDVVNGKSENGTFRGRIVLGSQLMSAASFSNLSKSWVREELIPFLDNADEFPFFYAWSPLTYPEETTFAWLDGDAQPVFDIDGYGAVTLSMRGVST